jgi:hypothetical protein
MAFSTSTWTSSSAEPTCSISRDARREECTIWTAIAPDAVFTVRSYGDTGSLYGPGLRSAQISSAQDQNPQVSGPPARRAANRVTSQVGDTRTCMPYQLTIHLIWGAVSKDLPISRIRNGFAGHQLSVASQQLVLRTSSATLERQQ